MELTDRWEHESHFSSFIRHHSHVVSLLEVSSFALFNSCYMVHLVLPHEHEGESGYAQLLRHSVLLILQVKFALISKYVGYNK